MSTMTRNGKKILIIQLKIYSFVNCVVPVRNSDKFFSIRTYFAIIWRERLFESKVRHLSNYPSDFGLSSGKFLSAARNILTQ